MLEWYAETFKLSARELTSKALRRIKLLTALSLPAIPLLIIKTLGEIPDNFTVPFFLVLAVSLLSFICLSFTKFVNRFWSRDRYLDEWEKARKHQAMAFAFQFVSYSLAGIMIGSIFFDSVSIRSLNLEEIGIVAIGLLAFGLYVMHFYLLSTINPIDELEKHEAAFGAPH